MIIKSMVHGKVNYTVAELFKVFYHVQNNKDIIRSFKDDFIASVFLGAGSGLLSDLFRGLYFRMFLSFKFPASFGARFKIINLSNLKMGKNTWIKNDVTFVAGGPLSIGDNCVFSERSSIWSLHNGIRIGSNVSVGIGSYINGQVEIADEVRIADSVRIYSWNHNFVNAKLPVSRQGLKKGTVSIRYNCWVGSGAVILSNVTVGQGSVVAAGAVVTKNVPEHCVVAGVPAKIIKRLR